MDQEVIPTAEEADPHQGPPDSEDDEEEPHSKRNPFRRRTFSFPKKPEWTSSLRRPRWNIKNMKNRSATTTPSAEVMSPQSTASTAPCDSPPFHPEENDDADDDHNNIEKDSDSGSDVSSASSSGVLLTDVEGTEVLPAESLMVQSQQVARLAKDLPQEAPPPEQATQAAAEESPETTAVAAVDTSLDSVPESVTSTGTHKFGHRLVRLKERVSSSRFAHRLRTKTRSLNNSHNQEQVAPDTDRAPVIKHVQWATTLESLVVPGGPALTKGERKLYFTHNLNQIKKRAERLASSVLQHEKYRHVATCIQFCYALDGQDKEVNSKAAASDASSSIFQNLTVERAMQYYFRMEVPDNSPTKGVERLTTVRGLEKHIHSPIGQHQQAHVESLLNLQSQLHGKAEAVQTALSQHARQSSWPAKRFAFLLAKGDAAVVMAEEAISSGASVSSSPQRQYHYQQQQQQQHQVDSDDDQSMD